MYVRVVPCMSSNTRPIFSIFLEGNDFVFQTLESHRSSMRLKRELGKCKIEYTSLRIIKIDSIDTRIVVPSTIRSTDSSIRYFDTIKVRALPLFSFDVANDGGNYDVSDFINFVAT